MDQQRTLSHPGDATRFVPNVCRHATAVVVDRQRDGTVRVGELDGDAIGIGVASDIRQRLLRDAVEHDLGVLADRG